MIRAAGRRLRRLFNPPTIQARLIDGVQHETGDKITVLYAGSETQFPFCEKQGFPASVQRESTWRLPDSKAGATGSVQQM